ncbi:SHOCT domain-containing protein [Angustibacter sp. McL0619]|uniref:SHOCT domain-containing protein n=1 Tax=Angustibacter sp. McL0619 TaxID=3415676 RepID=UPI003CF6936D
MSLSMLVIWALLVYLGYLLGRASRSAQTQPHDLTPAVQVLDDRLARGDIDPDEYSRRLSVLSQPRR